MRIALGIEYNGSKFCGWQSQPSGCGIQDFVEAALSSIAGNDIKIISSGRTDTGVHALDLVVHFDTDVIRPLTAWVRGANSFLPDSIAIRWAKEVSIEFHARYSTLERHYRYALLNSAIRPALLHGQVGWFHQTLQLEAMQNAALLLIGEKDFSSFRAAECQARSPVRNLKRVNIERQGDMVFFDFTADGFLQHMVRNIVGCLVYVGKGAYPPEWLQHLLDARDRSLAAPTFSADGLYLVKISYDAHWALPQTSPHRISF